MTGESERATSQRGLYGKYKVTKAGEPVEQCFVLEPENDPAALAALKTYALETDDDWLAGDLAHWISTIEDKKLGECQTCGVRGFVGEGKLIPVWENQSDAEQGELPDYLGCTECHEMEEFPDE